MGYEIILIAHFVYVLAMYSTAVKEFQLYLFILIEWFRCLPLEGMVMQKYLTRKNSSGFTLIELLIVIAIIGTLLATGILQLPLTLMTI